MNHIILAKVVRSLLCLSMLLLPYPPSIILGQSTEKELKQETENPLAHDKRVMDEVQKQVESLPIDKKTVVGTEIVRSALPKLKSKSMRQKTLSSLGDLYLEQGEKEQSIDFYKKAIAIDGSTSLATYSTIRLASILQQTGDINQANQLINDLDEISMDRKGNRSLREKVFSEKVNILIKKNQFNKAFEYCKQIDDQLNKNNSIVLYNVYKIPEKIQNEGKNEEAIQWYDKIYKNFESASTHLYFNLNYISALRYCDPKCTKAELIRLGKAIDKFAIDFPNELAVPDFYASYADSLFNSDLDDKAEMYYQKALAHSKVTDSVKLGINKALELIKSKKEDSDQHEKLANKINYNSSSGFYLVIINVFFIACLLAYVFFQKWKQFSSR